MVRDDPRPVTRLPVNDVSGTNNVASARSVSASLSEEETNALLKEVPGTYRTQINDVLLAALALAVKEWSGERLLLVDLEGHGREYFLEGVEALHEPWDGSPPCFQCYWSSPETEHAGELLKSVKEQLRQIPNRGVGFGLLRYTAGSTEVRNTLRTHSRAEVSFNYLGQVDRTLPARRHLAGLASQVDRSRACGVCAAICWT